MCDYLCVCVCVCVCTCVCRYAERTVRDGSFSTSTVVVLNVSALLDYALFTCHASNALGEDSLQIQLVSTSTYTYLYMYIYIICHMYQ